jgi:hypothetical protein
MSTFGDALTALFVFLEQAGQIPPTRNVWVLEVDSATRVDDHGRLQVRQADFRVPADYETRFQELLSAGLPWINVGCYGVTGNKLVVVVEVPGNTSGQAKQASINYSGPTKVVSDHGWDATEVLAIE